MRKLVVLAGVVSLVGWLALAERAAAWNKPGHKAVAAVAYLNLSTETRARVDTILRGHPDFARLSAGLKPEDPQLGLFVFLRAAEWPDVIRNDPRFYNDDDPKAAPTPPLPGFPGMGRHRPWHFIAQGFSTDGTPTEAGTGPDASTQIRVFQRTLGDPDVSPADKGYNLAWLLHLVGDVHQPLHAISRFSALHPKGDRGGNFFQLSGDESDLHALWDGAVTTENDSKDLVVLARELMMEVKRDPGEVEVGADVRGAVGRWIDESVVLSKYVAYTLGGGKESAAPMSVPGDYRRLAREIARHRAVVAGYRLAELIEKGLSAQPNP